MPTGKAFFNSRCFLGSIPSKRLGFSSATASGICNASWISCSKSMPAALILAYSV